MFCLTSILSTNFPLPMYSTELLLWKRVHIFKPLHVVQDSMSQLPKLLAWPYTFQYMIMTSFSIAFLSLNGLSQGSQQGTAGFHESLQRWKYLLSTNNQIATVSHKTRGQMYPEWSHFALLYQWLRKQTAVEVTRPHSLDE